MRVVRPRARRRFRWVVGVMLTLVVSAVAWFFTVPRRSTFPVAGPSPTRAVPPTPAAGDAAPAVATQPWAIVPDGLAASGYVRREISPNSVSLLLAATLPPLTSGSTYQGWALAGTKTLPFPLGVLGGGDDRRYELTFHGGPELLHYPEVVVQVHPPAESTTTPYVILRAAFPLSLN